MQIVDLIDKLPHSGEYSKRYWPPYYAIIHHSATSPRVSPYIIADYHVNVKKYPAIAYHALIYPDGMVYQTNDWDAISWHAGCAAVHGPNCPDNANLTGIGICLVGDFTNEPPAPAQLEAAGELIIELSRMYGPLKIIGHKEAHAARTRCPGDTWTSWRVQLEDKVEDRIKTARWHCEEAVREIERVLEVLEIKLLQAARERLVEKVIPQLYEMERHEDRMASG